MKIINFAAVLAFAMLVTSCISVKQKTRLNPDGSGSIEIHYSAEFATLSMGDEIGDFAFSEAKAKQFLSSATVEAREVKLTKTDSDSVVSVTAAVSFRDFNKLGTARTFSKFRTIWEKDTEGYRFEYSLHPDSLKIGNPGAEKNQLEFEFEFPGEVISSNGEISGNKAKWTFDIAAVGQGLNMNARIKADSGICGGFGYELPVIVLLGLLGLYTLRNILKRNSPEKKA